MAAPPNLAYTFGTTPATGGYAALLQAITTQLLGVNTTIAAAIGSTGSQAVTPGAMTNIGVGSAVWINWNLSDQECVTVTATTGSTFTANFTKTHAINSTVTCGLPQMGVVSPWTSISVPSPFTTFGISKIFISNQNSAAGMYSYIPIVVGTTTPSASPIVGMALGSADDIDTAGNAKVQFPANGGTNGTYAGNFFSAQNFPIQDTTFNWWMINTEYSLAFVALIGANYQNMYAGALRCPAALQSVGVTTATTTLAASGSNVTIPLAVDITKNLTVGQNIMIINQSHLGSSTNWDKSERQAIVSLVGGASPTVTVTLLTNSYDTGAAVGNIPQNCVASSQQGAFTASMSMTRNNDGTWTSGGGQTGTPDTPVITTGIADTSPAGANSINHGVYGGELDIPIYQTTAGYTGISGFLMGLQYFGVTGVSAQDYFADLPLVWKAFISTGTASAGFGPIINAQNTTTVVGFVP